MVYEDDDADEEFVEDDGFDEDDLLECPSCRRNVHEDTQKCPHCGDWITPVYPASRGRRWGWMAVVVLMIALMLMIAVL